MELKILQNFPNERFTVDVMLGKLARYLIMLGFDCLYRKDFPDDRILDCSIAQNQAIISRDLELIERASAWPALLLKTTVLSEQLLQVKQRFDLEFSSKKLFQRCIKCNLELEEIEKSRISDRIPEETYNWLDKFYRCQLCGQIYWKGTHYRAIKQLLEEWNLLDK